MTFSNTNLEKLIQMATIEQMYSMLQKLKENVDYFNECNVEGKKHSKNTNITVNESVVTETLVTEIKTLHSEIRNIHDNLTKYNEHVLKLDTKITTHSKNVNTNIELVTEIQNIHNNLTKYNEHVLKLETKIEDLEKELHEIKSNTNNNSKFLCQQIRGQESLTSYPGFSNGNQKEQMVIKEEKEEVHIKLKIEEKDINESTTSLCVLTNLVKDEEEDDLDEEKEDEEKEDELELDEDEEKEDDLDEEKEDDLDEEKEDEKEDEKDEESEEEVGTDDDESKNLDLEKEEEEEEVFEIEIDDISYFVTDEENSILYEITSDGDIGKKVGIIKNGDPIFN
jgi:hypothetical protein